MTYTMRSGYVWTPGSRLGADADEIGAAIERIEARGAHVNIETLIDEGRAASSPLYPLFEHDEATAAHEHHKAQARHILKSIRYREIDPRTEEEQAGARVFLPLRDTGDTTQPGVYVRVVMAPAPVAPAQPTRISVVTAPPAPVTVAPVALPLDDAPALVPVRMAQSSAMLRAHLFKLAETLERDPYFAPVVGAIRALP